MGKQLWRTQKFIDSKQQLRFALELVLYALLFPMWFLLLSLAAAVANSYMGTHEEKMNPLLELLAFCTGHWWEFLIALAMISGVSIFFSHKIVGPIHRFENALIQKTENPTEPVSCRLRKTDYFQDFSRRLHEFLNAPQALAGSGVEGSTQSPEIYDEDSEVSA